MAAANLDGGDWLIVLENGTQRYKTCVAVAHDDTTVDITEYGAVAGPGVGVLPVSFDADISGGDLRILAVVTGTGWSYYVRNLDYGLV